LPVTCWKFADMGDADTLILCDPQTSGGLLVSIDPAESVVFESRAQDLGLTLVPIGELHAAGALEQTIVISE